MNLPEHITSLPTCPETGLFVQRYESSYLDDGWTPSLPEGWEVFDDQYEGRDEYQKWHESTRVRRIGPERAVWAASAAQVQGVTLALAEVN